MMAAGPSTAVHLHPAPPLLQPCCVPAQDVPSIPANHFPHTRCPWATQVLPTSAQWPLDSADVLWLSGKGPTAHPTPAWDTLGLPGAGGQWGAQNWLQNGPSTDTQRWSHAKPQHGESCGAGMPDVGAGDSTAPHPHRPLPTAGIFCLTPLQEQLGHGFQMTQHSTASAKPQQPRREAEPELARACADIWGFFFCAN